MNSEQKKEPQEDGITRISVCGFKSIAEECSIDVRPLTILAGANSSGKSSIMQPLLLMKQTLEAPFDPPGAFLLSGPNVEFTSTDQILSKTAEDRRSSVGIVGPGPSSFSGSYKGADEDKFDIEECCYRLGTLKTRLWPGMTEEHLAQNVIKRLFGYPYIEEHKEHWQTKVYRCFLEIESPGIKDENESIPSGRSYLRTPFVFHLNRIIHVPGIRGNPQRAYPRTAIREIFPGRFVDYVASLISEWEKKDDERLATLGRYLTTLGLTSGVKAVQKDAASVEVFVPRLSGGSSDAEDLVNIADVGFGVSQVLPVLVALLAAERGQLVYLEQPELHLHPRAQVALAGILAEAAKRGVRVVAETHSALLLLAIQTLVAEGELPPEQVILHWFERGDDGVTRVTSREVDEKGAFGDWPEDFGDVELKLESRYLDAAQKRAMSK